MIKHLACKDSTVRIVPDCGMNSIEIILRGKSIMRRISGEAELRSAPNVYGTPLLIPANRTEGGRFEFQGREYSLGINEQAHGNFLHGYLSRAAFTLLEQTDTSLHGMYENKGEIFPFPFKMDVFCELYDGEYLQRFVLTNTGETAMPVCFAVHAAFDERPSFSAGIGEAYLLNEHFIPTGERRALNEDEREILHGTASKGKAISGFYTMERSCATVGDTRICVSKNFNQWILWNQGGDKGFICIEPQCGAVNCLNSGDGLLILDSGSSEEFTLSLSRT